MLKLVVLALLAVATSSYGDMMDDEKDIDTFCVERKLKHSSDVDNAINNCLKDSSDVSFESDPRNHPENLKKKLKELSKAYWVAMKEIKSRKGSQGSKNKRSGFTKMQAADQNVNEDGELMDRRNAEKDENEDDESFDVSKKSDPVAWGSRRRATWSSRRRASWSSRRRGSFSSRRRASWSSRRRVVWRRRSRRRVVWRRRTRRRVVWRRRTRRRIVLRRRRRTSGVGRRRTWRRRYYGRPGRPTTDGCSIPWGYAPYKGTFTSSCNKHDVCYYREFDTRKQCDKKFLRNMLNSCRRKYGILTRWICNGAARIYYAAVRWRGASKYG